MGCALREGFAGGSFLCFTFCNHCLGTGIVPCNPNRSSLLRYCNSCNNCNTSFDCHRLLTYQNSLKNSLTLFPIPEFAYFQCDTFPELLVLLWELNQIAKIYTLGPDHQKIVDKTMRVAPKHLQDYQHVVPGLRCTTRKQEQRNN